MKSMTSERLLSLLGLMPVSSWAYTNSLYPRTATPFVRLPVEDCRPPTATRDRPRQQLPSNVYDFGIGKNKPVASSNNHHSAPANIYEAAQFWTEHEPVRELTNPSIRDNVTAPQKKTLPSVVLTRHADDYLPIYKATSSYQDNMIVLDRTNDGFSSFDINTPWIEMLIHEQQQASYSRV